ncbi:MULTISPECIES: hypothetical protein [unclassified Pseudodesulfovibrio]|uniref:polysaccharide deacetylase WbmS family protein n=1 Tax=unclassified Pseudodesulfovibrio TaxID=2661612 RepID=UPI000FEBD6E3|nr:MULTISPECIES: hypothetical protein [unclassified Pseudodesulfovibrio]MCJ2165642.1 hypothetical protein [Pseudodesulfovibrio sp. S3-i]RWU03049.1 hypothetical protein DWB63_13455 [Pseudodesulfovibrio sp. S3]
MRDRHFEDVPNRPLMVLTFDTDWVPQFMLDRCLELLERGGAKATIFCTGRYSLGKSGLFEAALHPNFLPGSTQGADPESVVQGLKDIYPEAIGSRSHKYFWHSDIRPLLKRHGMLYDCSQYLPGQPHVGLVEHLGIKRVGTWWSDNLHLLLGYDLNTFSPPNLNKPGLQVLDFHPIHVYLNTPDRDRFRQVMAQLPPVPKIREEDIAPHRFEGQGIGTLLESAIEHLNRVQESTWTMGELVRRSLS